MILSLTLCMCVFKLCVFCLFVCRRLIWQFQRVNTVWLASQMQVFHRHLHTSVLIECTYRFLMVVHVYSVISVAHRSVQVHAYWLKRKMINSVLLLFACIFLFVCSFIVLLCATMCALATHQTTIILMCIAFSPLFTHVLRKPVSTLFVFVVLNLSVSVCTYTYSPDTHTRMEQITLECTLFTSLSSQQID